MRMTELNTWCVASPCPPLSSPIFPSPPSSSPARPLLIPHPRAHARRSHATYYFIAAGCRWSLRDLPAAQRLLDAIPALIDRKKIGGKDLPTEVLIKKKRACRRGVLMVSGLSWLFFR